MVLANLVAAKYKPSILGADLKSVNDIVTILLDLEMYDTAITLLRLYDLELFPIFHHICLRCAFGNPDNNNNNNNIDNASVVIDSSFDGLESSKNTYWLLLKKVLERFDNVKVSNNKYRLYCVEQILSMKNSCDIPSWLISDLRVML